MSVLHQATVAEVADLLRLFDYRLSQLVAAQDAEAKRGRWKDADPVGWAHWLIDFANMQGRYAEGSASARDVVAITPDAIAAYTPQQAAWDDVVTAWTNAPASGQQVDYGAAGGFDDLVRRFSESPAGDLTPTFPNDPKPKAPDPDLAAYQAADAAAKAVEGAADAAKKGAKGLLRSPWTWGAFAAIGGVLLIAWKVR